MAAHAHRESSRLHARVAVTALASIAVALVSSIGGPAVAVPPSVPSVNYQIGTGAHTSGWDFGVTGPSSRSYPLTATTTTISITLPFDRVEILDCVLRDPDLGVIASSSSTRDSAGPNTATIAVPAGRVDRAVGTAYTVTCLDGYVDVWRVTYLLTLQSGVVPVVALTPTRRSRRRMPSAARSDRHTSEPPDTPEVDRPSLQVRAFGCTPRPVPSRSPGASRSQP